MKAICIRRAQLVLWGAFAAVLVFWAFVFGVIGQQDVTTVASWVGTGLALLVVFLIALIGLGGFLMRCEEDRWQRHARPDDQPGPSDRGIW